MLQFVQELAAVGGDVKLRDKARRIRDSTLRAVSMTCWSTFNVYRTALLTNVTLAMKDVLPFTILLQSNPNVSGIVKSVRFSGAEGLKVDEYREAITTFLLAEAQSKLNTPGHHIVGRDDRDQLNGAKSLHKQFYMAIGQLQTLIVESSYSVPPLDVEFLAEHREAFAGLSNVKEVALDFHSGFKENKKKTWWGQSAELEKDWRGGSAKTQSLIDLLTVTRALKSLELSQSGGETQEGDRTIVFSSCLLGASSSSGSLQNLRIIGITGDQNSPTATPYHLFKNLKVLVLHQVALLYLSAFPEMRLPSSLQIFVSPYYSWFPSSEDAVTWHKGDLDVGDVVSSRFLPNLRVVIVPAEPINERGEIIESVEFRKEWVERRKKLESLNIFKSGRVELRKLTLRQMAENPFREESFPSITPWLSTAY